MAGKKTLNLQWNGYEATFEGDKQITLVNGMLSHINEIENHLTTLQTLIKVIEDIQKGGV